MSRLHLILVLFCYGILGFGYALFKDWFPASEWFGGGSLAFGAIFLISAGRSRNGATALLGSIITVIGLLILRTSN